MRIIIVGAWFTNIYEEPLAKGFENIRHEIFRFKYSDFFKNAHLRHYQKNKINWAKSFFYKFQNKFLIGPVIQNINIELFKICKEFRPDVVFFYRATHIRSRTIRKIKEISDALLISFHNDDPFVDKNKFYSRNYINSLGLMDLNYVYRKKNINDVLNYAKCCDVLLPYPNTDFIFPIKNIQKKHDVVFIGHYESDGRDQNICDLIADESVDFKLYGTDWDKSPLYPYICHNVGEIKPVYHADYNRHLNESIIAICFLSSLNNDKYTRRTFEIPASGTLLLSQFTDESAKLFIPDEEAVYFNSPKQLIEKIHFYLANKTERERIALNGYKKIFTGGHTYTDRAKQVIKDISAITLQRAG